MNKKLLALALLLSVGCAQAESDDSDRIALAADQTLRLNVMAESSAGGSCEVLLSFLDRSGQPMRDAAGRQLSQRISLAPGQSAYLEVRGRDVPAAARAGLAPAIRVEPDGADHQCPGVMANVEVLDGAPERTAMSGTGPL